MFGERVLPKSALKVLATQKSLFSAVLSEGNSRFGVVSKFINKATMANYAVVEWNVKGMDRKVRRATVSVVSIS